MQLKITSDGTPANTHVYAVTEQGDQEIKYVKRVDWWIRFDGRAIATIEVQDVALEALGETESVELAEAQ